MHSYIVMQLNCININNILEYLIASENLNGLLCKLHVYYCIAEGY